MSWIITNMEWILIVGGALTTSMIVPMVAPRFAFNFMFGEVADGPLGTLLSRNWGQMIFATGLLLIYAAYHEEARLPILLFASFTKLTFALLVISNWARYKGKPAILVAFGDVILAGLFVWYLLVTS